MDPATDWLISNGAWALDLDGSDDYINTGDLSAAEDNEFTYSLWANFPTITANDYLFSEGNTANANTIVGIFHPSATQVGVFFRDDAGTEAAFLSDMRATVTTGVFYHLAVSVDGSKCRFYLNSALVNTADRSTVPGGAVTLDTSAIGALSRSSVSSFGNLLVDDIRVYSRALSPSEVFLLSLRRGISYEMRERRRATPQVFNASWSGNSNVILQPGAC